MRWIVAQLTPTPGVNHTETNPLGANCDDQNRLESPTDALSGVSDGASHADPAGPDLNTSSVSLPEMEYLREINSDLRTKIDLLESENSQYKSQCSKQKRSIKKLRTKVDSLQKAISKTTGVQKLMQFRSCGVGDFSINDPISTDTSSENLNNIIDKTQADLALSLIHI